MAERHHAPVGQRATVHPGPLAERHHPPPLPAGSARDPRHPQHAGRASPNAPSLLWPLGRRTLPPPQDPPNGPAPLGAQLSPGRGDRALQAHPAGLLQRATDPVDPARELQTQRALGGRLRQGESTLALRRSPKQSVKAFYEGLRLRGYKPSKLDAYLDQVGDYQPQTGELSADEVKLVYKEWVFAYSALGYRKRAHATPVESESP